MTYAEWIAAIPKEDIRNRCAAQTQRMVAAFPELRRVRGHFCYGLARLEHWWCQAPDGTIVDPTAAQFYGQAGSYVEYTGPDPLGKCPNCGSYVWSPGFQGCCSQECATDLGSYLQQEQRA